MQPNRALKVHSSGFFHFSFMLIIAFPFLNRIVIQTSLVEICMINVLIRFVRLKNWKVEDDKGPPMLLVLELELKMVVEPVAVTKR